MFILFIDFHSMFKQLNTGCWKVTAKCRVKDHAHVFEVCCRAPQQMLSWPFNILQPLSKKSLIYVICSILHKSIDNINQNWLELMYSVRSMAPFFIQREEGVWHSPKIWLWMIANFWLLSNWEEPGAQPLVDLGRSPSVARGTRCTVWNYCRECCVAFH